MLGFTAPSYDVSEGDEQASVTVSIISGQLSDGIDIETDFTTIFAGGATGIQANTTFQRMHEHTLTH